MTLSMTCASRGRRSQTFKPGTLDGMQPSSPRISSGASGLGSNVSSWLGEPYMKSRMHDLAWPNPGRLAAGTIAAARACDKCCNSGRASPSKPERADLKQLAPRQAVAETFRTAQDPEHRRPPRTQRSTDVLQNDDMSLTAI